MFGNRTHVPRIPELLDNLKAEFESLAHDVTVYKLQRDDYERVCKYFLDFLAYSMEWGFNHKQIPFIKKKL